MAMQKPFLHAGFLSHLAQLAAAAPVGADIGLPRSTAGMPVLFDADGTPTSAAVALLQLLKAKQALLRAASDTVMVADALRRYQKFARPGQPSPHVVQLRQQQAAARRAGSQSRQAFVQAGVVFVREAGIAVPPRVALDVFLDQWIDASVPPDADNGSTLQPAPR